MNEKWYLYLLTQNPCFFPHAKQLWAQDLSFQYVVAKGGKSANSHSALSLFFALPRSFLLRAR
jgi:hypothetical protein